MAMTEKYLDTRVQKMTVRKMNSVCDLIAEMLLITTIWLFEAQS